MSLKDWDLNNKGHLIFAHLHGRKVKLNIFDNGTQISPKIFVDSIELCGVKERYNLPDEFIVAFSTSKTAVTKNKNIDFSRLHDFWTALANEYVVVQLGMLDDPPIPNAVDLRGKTGLREVFSVVSLCNGVVAPEGFPNHVAASLGKSSFVLSTGYTRRKYYAYHGKTKFFSPSEQAVECLPCWKSTDCQFDLACVSIPSAEAMVKEIKKEIRPKLSWKNCS
ncbi:hypothetical protein FZCC0188_11625 [Rhodobacterales bacterium FZCC0188]|nr:hypothetical protein [Rhodobacterales bacterium FZCC0188]